VVDVPLAVAVAVAVDVWECAAPTMNAFAADGILITTMMVIAATRDHKNRPEGDGVVITRCVHRVELLDNDDDTDSDDDDDCTHNVIRLRGLRNSVIGPS
jgi:hypothetical protein